MHDRKAHPNELIDNLEEAFGLFVKVHDAYPRRILEVLRRRRHQVRDLQVRLVGLRM